jgi:N-acylneuraminate cytidylyltransferase
MKNIAVILARGGSKGILNKNITPICGKPLISYAISASILSDVDETWVSTDSNEIAEISRRYNAKILKRPSEYATDTASSELALVHFCENITSDNVIFIQPTSPLLLSSDINDGIKLMERKDSVFSGYLEHWIPRWKMKDGVASEHLWNTFKRPRRQDKDKLIVENGAFYIAKRDFILSTKLRYGGNVGVVEMPFSRSFQIDEYSDVYIVESLIKNGILKKNN